MCPPVFRMIFFTFFSYKGISLPVGAVIYKKTFPPTSAKAFHTSVAKSAEIVTALRGDKFRSKTSTAIANGEFNFHGGRF